MVAGLGGLYKTRADVNVAFSYNLFQATYTKTLF